MVFEYSQKEKIIMAIITGLSNASSIPVSLLTKRQKNTFVFFIAIFSTITSVMYHVCESLDVIVVLKQQEWHKLDNIGAICSLNSLIQVLMNHFGEMDTMNRYNYFSILFSLIIQQRGPWDIINTLIPIFMFLIFAMYDWYKHGIPKFNMSIVLKGGAFMMIAIAMFVRGLDDLNDYLRIYHSLWHVFIGISTFYLWQINEKKCLTMQEVVNSEIDEILNYLKLI